MIQNFSDYKLGYVDIVNSVSPKLANMESRMCMYCSKLCNQFPNNRTINKTGCNHLYDKVMQCRRDEISNLWKRSTLLITLLVFVFSGYGKFWLKIFTSENLHISLFNCHLISICICIIGCFISEIWIMTSKSSKYWVDRYEYILSATVESNRNCYKTPENFASISKLSEIIESFNGKAPETEQNEKNFKNNKSLFSVEAYRYSPSRINIVIGQISLVIWLFLFVVHLFFQKCLFWSVRRYFCSSFCQFLFLIFLISLLLAGLLILKKKSEGAAKKL